MQRVILFSILALWFGGEMAPSAYAQQYLSANDVSTAMSRRTESARIKALKELASSPLTFRDPKSLKLLKVLQEAVSFEERRGEFYDRSPELTGAVFEFMAKKLGLLPTALLDTPGGHHLVLLSLVKNARTPADIQFLLRHELQERRSGESLDDFGSRIGEAVSVIQDELYRLRTEPSEEADKAKKLVAMYEENFSKLLTSKTPEVRKEAMRGLALHSTDYRGNPVIRPMTAQSWGKLLRQFGNEIKEGGRDTALRSMRAVLLEHAEAIGKDAVNHSELSKSVADFVKNADQAQGLELASELLRWFPVDSEDDRKKIEDALLLQFAKRENLAESIALARALGTRNTDLQSALYDVLHRSTTTKSVKKLAGEALDALSEKNLLTLELVEKLLELERNGRLRFSVSEDPRLQKAYHYGPKTITQEFVDSLRYANTTVLNEVANDAARRNVNDPRLLKAVLERVFSDEIKPDARKWLVNNVTPKLGFPDGLVQKVLNPLRENSALNGAMATFALKNVGDRMPPDPPQNPLAQFGKGDVGCNKNHGLLGLPGSAAAQ
jgi:hypothetical protein